MISATFLEVYTTGERMIKSFWHYLAASDTRWQLVFPMLLCRCISLTTRGYCAWQVKAVLEHAGTEHYNSPILITQLCMFMFAVLFRVAQTFQHSQMLVISFKCSLNKNHMWQISLLQKRNLFSNDWPEIIWNITNNLEISSLTRPFRNVFHGKMPLGKTGTFAVRIVAAKRVQARLWGYRLGM